jgi:hypothetical protein
LSAIADTLDSALASAGVTSLASHGSRWPTTFSWRQPWRNGRERWPVCSSASARGLRWLACGHQPESVCANARAGERAQADPD